MDCAKFPTVGVISVLFFFLSGGVSSADYELLGKRLNAVIARDALNGLKCAKSTEFHETLQCKPVSSSEGRRDLSDTVLLDASNNTLLYASRLYNVQGLPIQAKAEAEIKISRSLGGASPKTRTEGAATILIWGDVRLEEIASGSDEFGEIKSDFERKYGLLLRLREKNSSTAVEGIFRVIGGDGLIAVVSQSPGNGVDVHEFIVAAGALSERNFALQGRQLLLSPQFAQDGTQGWGELALLIRRLALNTSPEKANVAADAIFDATGHRKFRSHVWAYLPSSVLKHLTAQTYWAADVFGPKTEFPAIRAKLIEQLDQSPREPFVEFILYALGRFKEAADVAPSSPIRTPVLYAQAHSRLRDVLIRIYERISTNSDKPLLKEKFLYKSYLSDETREDPDDIANEDIADKENTLSAQEFFEGSAGYHIKTESYDDYRDGNASLSQYIGYFNQFPERHRSYPLAIDFPEFVELSKEPIKYFTEVLADDKSPHFDDAAYFLGWLAYHNNRVSEALSYYEKAVAFSNKETDGSGRSDYSVPAQHNINRILRTLPPREALDRVRASQVLSAESEAWTVAITSAYNLHAYELAESGAKDALRVFGVQIETLPVTTDPDRIASMLSKLKLEEKSDLQDIIYIYNASRQISSTLALLAQQNSDKPTEALINRVKDTVVKFGLTKDSELEKRKSRRVRAPVHKDLRQSIYVAQRALETLPKSAPFGAFREWLHYKRIKLLARFDPTAVGAANAEFQRDLPTSSLLDDGMAEQIFAEAVVIVDMAKATDTFNSLLRRFPNTNAVDNAHSWMAIGLECAGRAAEARKMNEEIIRRFPMTRHASYARSRIKEPAGCDQLKQLYAWDYHAMRWRERNRLKTIQLRRIGTGGSEASTPR